MRKKDRIEIENLTINTDSEGADEDENDFDESEELYQQECFPNVYKICAEQASLHKKDYIFDIAYKKEPSVTICTAKSNGCEVYTLTKDQLTKIASLKDHENNVMNVKFCSESHSVFTGSKECIKMWDLRTCTAVLEFMDNPKCGRPFIDFDITRNDRLLCAGTELRQNAYLLFWDVRKANLMGGYWDTHTDDITKINFHPVNSNILSTGSTDGLINIYDLNETSEADALMYSLNTESFVGNLLWYTEKNSYRLCCILLSEGIQLWDAEEALRLASFQREDIRIAAKRKPSDFIYLGNAHTMKTTDDVFVLAGSSGNKHCVRGLNIRQNKLEPSFILQGNKQRIRASSYDPENDMLITGGEGGILSIWKPKDTYENNKMSLKSVSSKKKLHKCDPY